MGGTHGTIAAFPIGEVVGSSDEAYSKLQQLLGNEVEQAGGKRFRLVQAATADGITGRKKVYTWAAQASHTVDIAGNGEPVAGVQKSDQDSLAAGDLFWLQVAGVATCVDGGSGLAANVPVDADTGECNVVADEGAVSESIVGITVAAALAGADVQVRLRGGI